MSSSNVNSEEDDDDVFSLPPSLELSSNDDDHWADEIESSDDEEWLLRMSEDDDDDDDDWYDEDYCNSLLDDDDTDTPGFSDRFAAHSAAERISEAARLWHASQQLQNTSWLIEDDDHDTNPLIMSIDVGDTAAPIATMLQEDVWMHNLLPLLNASDLTALSETSVACNRTVTCYLKLQLQNACRQKGAPAAAAAGGGAIGFVSRLYQLSPGQGKELVQSFPTCGVIATAAASRSTTSLIRSAQRPPPAGKPAASGMGPGVAATVVVVTLLLSGLWCGAQWCVLLMLLGCLTAMVTYERRRMPDETSPQSNVAKELSLGCNNTACARRRRLAFGSVGAYRKVISMAESLVYDVVKLQRQLRFYSRTPRLRSEEGAVLVDACRSSDGDDDETNSSNNANLRLIRELVRGHGGMDVDPLFVGSDDEEGCALHAAASSGAARLVEFLIQGVSPYSEDEDGGLADLHTQDKDGWTALHYAAQANSIAVIRLLLSSTSTRGNYHERFHDDHDFFSSSNCKQLSSSPALPMIGPSQEALLYMKNSNGLNPLQLALQSKHSAAAADELRRHMLRLSSSRKQQQQQHYQEPPPAPGGILTHLTAGIARCLLSSMPCQLFQALVLQQQPQSE